VRLPRLVRLALSSLLVLGAAALPTRAARAEGADDAAPSRHRVAASVGFSHWFGSTFGSPDGVSTPMFAVGLRPGLSFVEIKARYTRSAAPAAVPGAARGLVGFASTELLLCRELRSGRQSLTGFAGALALFTHAGSPSIGGGYGAVLGAEYLVRTGLARSHAAGIFLAAHEVFYALPGERRDALEAPRRDAQIDLGLTTTLF
jgi:hypothetical protein